MRCKPISATDTAYPSTTFMETEKTIATIGCQSLINALWLWLEAMSGIDSGLRQRLYMRVSSLTHAPARFKEVETKTAHSFFTQLTESCCARKANKWFHGKPVGKTTECDLIRNGNEQGYWHDRENML